MNVATVRQCTSAGLCGPPSPAIALHRSASLPHMCYTNLTACRMCPLRACSNAACRRLSTFWATVSTGTTYAANCTGTPARHLRLWLPHTGPDDELVVHLNYFEPLRRYVWAPGQGRIEASTARPQIGDGAGHGSYVWDQVHHVLLQHRLICGFRCCTAVQYSVAAAVDSSQANVLVSSSTA